LTTEPEQVLENNLIDQLVGLGRQSVTIKTVKDLDNNLKNQLEKHTKKTFTASEFDRILMHLSKDTIFDKAKTLRDKFVLQKDNNEKARTFKKGLLQQMFA
jgi:type I restriction enzyme R subunit